MEAEDSCKIQVFFSQVPCQKLIFCKIFQVPKADIRKRRKDPNFTLIFEGRNVYAKGIFQARRGLKRGAGGQGAQETVCGALFFVQILMAS